MSVEMALLMIKTLSLIAVLALPLSLGMEFARYIGLSVMLVAVILVGTEIEADKWTTLKYRRFFLIISGSGMMVFSTHLFVPTLASGTEVPGMAILLGLCLVTSVPLVALRLRSGGAMS